MNVITIIEEVLEKLTPVLIVAIPSYFTYRSSKISKETDKRIKSLANTIDQLSCQIQSVKDTALENNGDLNLIRKGLQRLQRFRLQASMKQALKCGWTTQHELEEISRLFESYVELGGNGAIKILFERFSELDIREE